MSEEKNDAPLNAATVEVHGDAKCGWIVSVHDGDHFKTFSPPDGKCKTAAEAADFAERAMLKLFPDLEGRPIVRGLPPEPAAEEVEDAPVVDDKKRRAKAANVDGSGTA
jgi:hypothetical protein